MIEQPMAWKKKVGLFVDWQKVFDTVAHSTLVEMELWTGKRGRFLWWINDCWVGNRGRTPEVPVQTGKRNPWCPAGLGPAAAVIHDLY